MESSGMFAASQVVEKQPDGGWYHTVELPDGGTIEGIWDLRQCVDAYLGDYDFAGKRVLEIGPASGYLTFWMEDMGADVVAIDVSLDDPWDTVPRAGPPLAPLAERQSSAEEIRSCWWWLHRIKDSSAKVAYTGAYDLSDELGRFDTVVLAAVLMHLRHPFDALEAAARKADTLIITEKLMPRLERSGQPFSLLMPTADNHMWATWWCLSTAVVTRMLDLLGFDVVNRTDTAPGKVVAGSRARGVVERQEVPMYTLVAERRRS